MPTHGALSKAGKTRDLVNKKTPKIWREVKVTKMDKRIHTKTTVTVRRAKNKKAQGPMRSNRKSYHKMELDAIYHNSERKRRRSRL